MIGAKSSASIVLIGENGGERETLRNALVGQGYAVSVVSDAAFASLISEMTPQLVIVADSRACPAGATLFRELKASKRTESIPVLFVCDADADFTWAFGQVGVADRLCRPYTREIFLERVRLLIAFADTQGTLERMRRQVIETQKMECLGALAAGVVHEFNNLLFSVMGFAELALENDGSNVDVLKESARISRSCGQRASDVATSLLTFVRQAPGSMALGSFNDVVSTSVKLLRRDLEAHQVRLEMHLGELPKTRFAFGSMQQVILNLLINAWQAMQEQDSPRVLTVATAADSDSAIRLTVADTGPGVPPDAMDRLFEPFYTTKTGKEGSDARGGSGLGLAITATIIRDHNGTVSVRNVAGKGAEFSVWLPVEAIEDDAPDMSNNENVSSARPRSILVVNDEESSLKALSRLLIGRGHDVCLATNMAEAVIMLWSRPVDLIALDPMLPSVDGISNIRRLRDEGIKTPVLVCTGCPEQALIDDYRRDGANDAIVKPFSAAEFIRKMEGCLAAPQSVDSPDPDQTVIVDPTANPHRVS